MLNLLSFPKCEACGAQTPLIFACNGSEFPAVDRQVRTVLKNWRSVMPNYDAIIIGTGQAGPALARRLAGAGWKIAIIERKLFGGTCVNNGCTPTKTLIASAYAAYLARR